MSLSHNLSHMGVCYVNGRIYTLENLSMLDYRADGKVDMTITLRPSLEGREAIINKDKFEESVTGLLENLGKPWEYPKVAIVTEPEKEIQAPIQHEVPHTPMSSTDTGIGGEFINEEV